MTFLMPNAQLPLLHHVFCRLTARMRRGMTNIEDFASLKLTSVNHIRFIGSVDGGNEQLEHYDALAA